ncbi:CRACD-like protein isoform X2 [Dama dama]|uniref:CRACD-like protein isoform X2 n=1 Tax=Dama dama TaxID=30532 RepID=UPI002A360D46|nr:CRACD-like protein isoform X2 [Dama dama]
MPCAPHLPGGPTGLQELVDASVSSGPECCSGNGSKALDRHPGVTRGPLWGRGGLLSFRRMKVPEAPSVFTKMAAFYQCIKPEPSELDMISTRVMDIKLREAAEGLGEDSTGKKKSKFKTFKKFFGKKKRKESSSSTGSSTWKQSQAKNEVMAIESGPVGYDSEDELEDSRGTLGSRALSHDSIFIPESGQDPPRPLRVFSQENVCDRIKALQLKIQCNVKMGPPPPPGSLPTKRGDDAGMSSEDDGLPRSPPEMSLLHDIGSGTTIKVCVVSSSRPQSPDQLFSRQVSETSTSPRTSDSSMVPVADFDYPPEFSSCLDNSAAKHKLLVKPRNQRSSKMRRLSSRAQSESLSDLTCTPEEEEDDEKPLLQVSKEEPPSSGQQEAGQDGGSEPEGPATVLPPAGPRLRRARLQHCPALTASTEEESPPGENPSSHPATPEGTPEATLEATPEATLEVMEVTEPLSGSAPHSESPSRPEGSPHPNPDNENQREDVSLESACPPGGDTADEAVCASGDNVQGRLSTLPPEGDTTPPEPGPAATPETPPGPDGTDRAGQKETLPTLDLPAPEGAGPESPAAAPSPPPPKSCLKHKAPSPPASEAPPQVPAPRSPEQGAAPRGPPKAERAGSPLGAPERKTERGGCEASGAAKKFSVSSGREWPRAGGRLLEPRGPAVRLPLLRSGPAWKSEAALDDLPAAPEPQGPKPGPRKSPAPAERGSADTAHPAAQERAAGGEGGPFPVKLRSTSLSFKHREAPCPEGKAIKRYSAEVRLERGGLSLLSRDDKGPPGSGPSTRGARPPSEPGKAKTRPTEQLSSKPPLPRKPLLQTLTLPQLPAPPDTSSGDPEKVGLPMEPRKESRAERRSPHRATEKVAGPGTNGQPTPPWIPVGRQKRRGPLEQPPSQEDKPARTLKSDTGRPAKAPERTQEPVKQADFVRSKSFLMTPAKPPVDQRQGTKLRLQEGLQRGISLSHQNLAQSAAMMEKELHQLKRASYGSTDQPSWMELARKKSQAWSDMPQIIK